MSRFQSKSLKTAVYYFLTSVFFVVSGVFFATLGTERFPYHMGTFQAGVVCSACLISAFTDFTTCKILNVVTYPAFAVLVVFLLARNALPESWIKYPDGSYIVSPFSAILGCVFCFVALFIPWALAAGGAGDAKLAAVIGLGLGVSDGFVAVGASFIIAFTSLAYRVLAYVVKEATRPFWRRFIKRQEGDEVNEGNVASDAEDARASESNERPRHKIWVPMGVAFLFGTTGSALGLWNFLLSSIYGVAP